MLQKRLSALFVVFITTMLLLPSASFAEFPEFTEELAPTAPDYTQNSGWLSLPENPEQFGVDVFWVYPTVLFNDTDWLMDTTNEELVNAAHGTLVEQASVFSPNANLYAPLYRQMNMAALSLAPEVEAKIASYGYNDVLKAFTYYLEHQNNGRPFILAGHSQGSKVLLNIALEHWGKGKMKEGQMIAAYIIGWSVTKDDVRHNPYVKVCESATDTGCFIAYNCMAAGRQSVSPTLRPNSLTANPLTWKVDTRKAPATLNKGARFFLKDKTITIPEFTSAHVVDGGLIVVPKDVSLVTVENGILPEGIYHGFDYSLFFENLKANALDRIKAHAEK
ncbi:MAG: DUF3089 domain-containing protein [Desulfovibrio sp.]